MTRARFLELAGMAIALLQIAVGLALTLPLALLSAVFAAVDAAADDVRDSHKLIRAAIEIRWRRRAGRP